MGATSHSESYQILVGIDLLSRDLTLAISQDTTACDIIETIRQECTQRGKNLDEWKAQSVGADAELVLMRKAAGNAILPPDTAFKDLNIADNEFFKLATRPVVA